VSPVNRSDPYVRRTPPKLAPKHDKCARGALYSPQSDKADAFREDRHYIMPSRYPAMRVRHGSYAIAMINDVYNKRIIELAGNIPRLGRLDTADASATAHSKLCGSTVTVDLKMDGPVVTDFAHDVKACALGQASSSIMASHVVGSSATELRELRETVRKMLKENGSPPQGKWADIAVLEPVRDYKARHASTLLTFDAVVDAIGQIEGRRQQKAG
jgi:NifU-like protein involved in Fe-S cluster formation